VLLPPISYSIYFHLFIICNITTVKDLTEIFLPYFLPVLHVIE
jgi:hypothetical protein